LPSRINVVKCLLSGAIFCTVLVSRAPAQELEWIKPSLIGLPPARTSASMVYDPAMGATLLFGGDTYSTTFGDTWMFSKATGWKQLTPAVSPSPLTCASMAYDPTTKTVVLFGGLLDGGMNSDETWTWDGASWTQQFPSVSPSARNWNTNGMVFDSHLGKVVLFGGEENFVFNNETWEWDGTTKTWTQQFPGNSPSPREATLAYDETTSQVVLFAGWTNGITYDDTWTYNGVDWVQHQPTTSPTERADNGLAFDPILKGVVLFGGLAGPCEDCGYGRLNDTWLWNGENWNQVQTSKSAEPSSGVSFTYDGTTKGMLLFGGWVTDYQFTNSTWLFGLV
jgi:hypothetical protein